MNNELVVRSVLSVCAREVASGNLLSCRQSSLVLKVTVIPVAQNKWQETGAGTCRGRSLGAESSDKPRTATLPGR